MKYLLLLLLVVVVSGRSTHFPALDAFHSSCAINVTYPMTDCGTLYDKILDLVKSEQPMAHMGLYELEEEM